MQKQELKSYKGGKKVLKREDLSKRGEKTLVYNEAVT